MTTSAAAAAADYKKNPFTLVYEGAITRNEPGKVNIHPATYDLNGVKIAANVYTPANYDPKKRYAAIVVAHPNGGVNIETYWVPEYVNATMKKLTAFYARTL